MPINIWTQDQVPQLRLAGAQSLAGGISRGAESIRQALDQRIEESKRINQQGKSADSWFKALPDNLKPMSIDEWNNQDPGSKYQSMVGIIGAQKYQQDAEERRALIQQRAMRKQEMDFKRQAIEREADFNQRARFLAGEPNKAQMQAFYEGPDTVMPEERFRPTMGPITDDVILRAAAETGNLDSAIARAASQHRASKQDSFFKPEQLGNLIPFKMDGKVVPGAGLAITGPNASQIVIDPTSPLQSQTVIDPNTGLPTTFVIPNRGPIREIDTAVDIYKMGLEALNKTRLELVRQRGEYKPGDKSYKAIDEQIKAVDEQIEARIAPKGGSKTNPQAPRDPKQREANKVYVTPLGELRWTGTGWVQP